MFSPQDGFFSASTAVAVVAWAAQADGLPRLTDRRVDSFVFIATGAERAHGLDCLVELLGFEISLIKSGGEGVHNDLNVFGLDLLAATLSAGKSAFAEHDMMMSLIREDLFQAIFHLAKTTNLACLSGVTQVALGLYVHLGKQLLLQLEAYLNLVLLRVAEGKGPGGSDHQEAALEVMLQVTPPASSSLLFQSFVPKGHVLLSDSTSAVTAYQSSSSCAMEIIPDCPMVHSDKPEPVYISETQSDTVSGAASTSNPELYYHEPNTPMSFTHIKRKNPEFV